MKHRLPCFSTYQYYCIRLYQYQRTHLTSTNVAQSSGTGRYTQNLSDMNIRTADWSGPVGGTDLIAAVLVEHDQKNGHDHDDTDHDDGVEDRV